jgi:hypothetical protein
LIEDLFTRVRRRGILGGSYPRSCIVVAYGTGVQTLPPARLFSSWVVQDHRYEMVDARVGRQVKDEARPSPVTFLEYLPLLIGSGGPQELFSWLSEGVGGVFTVSTESSERTCASAFLSSGSDYRVIVVGGAGKYSLGMSPRNDCRNAWETVVL